MPSMVMADRRFVLISCFTRSYYGAEHLRQILHAGFMRAFQACEHASMQDLHAAIDAMYSVKLTYQRRDAIDGARLRLTRFQTSFPGPYQTRIGIPITTFCERSVYLPSMLQTDADEFLTALLVNHIFLYNRAHLVRDQLTHLICLDEGLLSFGAEV